MQFLTLRVSGNPGSCLVPYAAAWAFQKRLVEARAREEIPDTVLFVEHPAVVTRGRGLQRSANSEKETPRAMPLGPLSADTEYYEIERGGDLTWHGPGQLVVYPIVRLDGKDFGPDHDVTGFLRKLERTLGSWLAQYGLETEARSDATGIWVRPAQTEGERQSETRKMASIGIAVRKWVSYHGVGLNLANSLDGYRDISPCGFSPEVMTTLAKEVPRFNEESWSESLRSRVELEIASAFQDGSEVTTAFLDLDGNPDSN